MLLLFASLINFNFVIMVTVRLGLGLWLEPHGYHNNTIINHRYYYLNLVGPAGIQNNMFD